MAPCGPGVFPVEMVDLTFDEDKAEPTKNVYTIIDSIFQYLDFRQRLRLRQVPL
jgi:hypothetical protein